MDLYSGLPYWIVKNPLYTYFNPLQADYHTDVVIIGSGITGALVSYELCKADIKCTVVDKRSVTTGSSIASTALLQYEIDVPLCEMVKQRNQEYAVEAYRACLQSITDIENVFKEIEYNPDFRKVPSLFYASNRKGKKLIKKEYEIRKQYNLPVTYLERKQVQELYGIHAPAALSNNESAQIDAYNAATHLIDYNLKRNKLDVFSHTEITSYKNKGTHYELKTEEGYTLQCKYVIIAAGFEAGQFLPEQVMKLTSTYAIISQPVEEQYIWKDRSLIWETREPYLYIRTTKDNRIIVGGEDIDFRKPEFRDKLLRKKVSVLEKKIHKLLPHIPFVTEFAWCGTFSSTEDGLPFIGSRAEDNRMLYALGYGGNGITFSMIAAQLLKNKISGIPDDRERVFGFERIENK